MLRNYYRKASAKVGNTAETLIQLLECRLDALVLRAGLAPTIYAARQLVGHGHIRVNSKRVDIPSFQVRPGDTISVREKSRSMDMIRSAIQDTEDVPYLAVDRDTLTAALTRHPEVEEVPVIAEVGVVVEFYSK